MYPRDQCIALDFIESIVNIKSIVCNSGPNPCPYTLQRHVNNPPTGHFTLMDHYPMGVDPKPLGREIDR